MDKSSLKESGNIGLRNIKYQFIDEEGAAIEINVEKEIGFGGFAKVYQGEMIRKDVKQKVALKVIKYYKLDEKEEIIKEEKFLKELKDCPGVIKFICSKDIVEENNFLLVLELMEVDFYSYLESKGKRLSFKEYYSYFQQLVFNLAYMQKRGIQHRDLKSKNFLFNKKERRIKICDFGVAITSDEKVSEVCVAGTTRYMAPEIIRLLQGNNVEYLGTDGSEKILKPYHFQSMITMAESEERQETRKTIIFKNRNCTVKMSIENKYIIVYNGDSTADVFSLGLNVLESLGVGINKANEKEHYLKNALEQFKNLKNIPIKFITLVEKMLDWENSNRPDFIWIEDYLIYTLQSPKDYYIPLNLSKKMMDSKLRFVSKETFESIKLEDNLENMNKYFFSNGWKCVEIPKEYKAFLEEISKLNCGASLQEIIDLLKEIPSEQQHSMLVDILSKDDNEFTKLIEAYSIESFLFELINKTLANNNLDKNKLVKAYVSKFIAESCKKGDIDYLVKDEYVYRGIGIGKGKDAFVARTEYLADMVYCWPAFSSTSKLEEKSQEFLETHPNLQSILFKIKLNLKNQRNKLDISKCSIFSSQEEEVLLLPYFRFRVISNTPTSIAKKNVCLVEIEELGLEGNLSFSESNQKLFQFLWLDEYIDNPENDFYLDLLRTKYTNEIKPFSNLNDAIEFLRQTNVLTFVITSGGFGEEFIDKIHLLPHITKIAVFCFNSEKHKKWARVEKYPKLLGVFNDFFDLNKSVLNPFY